MTEPPTPPSAYRPPGRPAAAADREIFAAADALFRDGTWPSADALLARLGTGSKTTIHRVQRQWREALPRRISIGGSPALERLPESVAHAAEVLWIQAQEAARAVTRGEDARTREALTSERDAIEVQRHLFSLREQEMQRQLQDRDRAAEVLQAQIREQSLLLRKMQASRDEDARHIRGLLAKLESRARTARVTPPRARAPLAAPPKRRRPKPKVTRKTSRTPVRRRRGARR